MEHRSAPPLGCGLLRFQVLSYISKHAGRISRACLMPNGYDHLLADRSIDRLSRRLHDAIDCLEELTKAEHGFRSEIELIPELYLREIDVSDQFWRNRLEGSDRLEAELHKRSLLLDRLPILFGLDNAQIFTFRSRWRAFESCRVAI